VVIDLKTAIERIVQSGYQLSKDGFEFLSLLDEEEVEDLVKLAIHRANISADELYVIDREILQSTLNERVDREEKRRPLTGKGRERPLAAEYDAHFEVINDHESEPVESVDGFLEYFKSRYKKIGSLLRERMDVRDAVTISQIKKMPLRSKAKVVGIVSRKTARGARLFIELEDTEDSITAMASDQETVRRGLSILEDQVICVEALKYRGDLLIVNDFIWPDIPSGVQRRAEAPICTVFLADIHVGSRHFMGELFERFIRWMNLEIGRPSLRNLAGRVKYVVIAGDVVDGIGVYPNQINELDITDIREQYKVALSLISALPDYVEVIVIPGNHDAARNSLPQPPIPSEYTESFYQDSRIHMLGNPSRLLLDGVETLVCHGKALDDVLSQTPGLTFHSPVNGMELLLRCRHLAPFYGSTTPLAPEREDRLVITSKPDIFHMGHIHIYGSKRYKGVTMIASGPWQEQTSFQKRMNLTPTPGVAPVFDLHTHQLTPLDFNMLQG
jgi:DNA polymerase II small subunit